MIMRDILACILFIGILAAASPFLGRFIHTVMEGGKTPLHRALGPVEQFAYRISGIDPGREQSWRRYALSALVFSAAGFILTMAVLMLQGVLPLNPQGFSGTSWHLAFNTAASFATNTNWQSYAGEAALSHFSQMVGLTYQNFVSAAVGIAACMAICRAIARNRTQVVGNFWADLVRVILYVLLPLSILFAIFFISQGAVQTFQAGVDAATLEGGRQYIALGPAASQTAIKLLGTNGGGFFNANAAHPFENPTALSNFFQCLAMLLIPSSLVFTFGEIVKNRRHAWTIWCIMAAVFIFGVLAATLAEQGGTVMLAEAAGGAVPNLEGKEARFGVFGTALFATAATATSCGAVNAMHASFTPLGGLVPLFNMLLGEIIFGGAGSGLYGMILFMVLTVFIAGLMVGRTPDYLGKRIQAREVTWCMVALLIPAMSILGLSAVAAATEWGRAGLLNAGTHGFSEILYACASCTQNNGSAFAGMNADTPIWNVSLGAAMLMGRFGVMCSMMAAAGSMAARSIRPESEYSFPVEGATFGALTLAVIFVVGALTYLPALSLGPVVECFQMTAGRVF